MWRIVVCLIGLLSSSVCAQSTPLAQPISGRLFPDYEQAFGEEERLSTACGPLSLLEIAAHEGLRLSAGDRQRILAVANHGSNLYDLRFAAESIGLIAQPVTVAARELLTHNVSAIVHLDGYAFAAYLGQVHGRYRFSIPGEGSVLLTASDFESRFGREGHALLVSRKKLKLEQTDGKEVGSTGSVRADTLVSVGRLYNSSWNGDFRITNDTSESVTIREIFKSCTCIMANASKRSIPPGDFAIVSISGEEEVLGPFSRTLQVTFERDLAPISVQVRGMRVQPISVLTPGADFGKLDLNATATATIEARVGPDLEQDDFEFVIPDNCPVTVEVLCIQNQIARFSVNWQGSNKPGRLLTTVLVSARGLPGTSEFFVGAKVSPKVTVMPLSLYVSDDELSDSKWQRELTLHGVDLGSLVTLSEGGEDKEHKLVTDFGRNSDGKYYLKISAAGIWDTPSIKNLRVEVGGKQVASVALFVGDESFNLLE